MTGAMILWGVITLGGGILQLILDPAKAAQARADRLAAELAKTRAEAAAARRIALLHAARPIKPATRAWLGPRSR